MADEEQARLSELREATERRLHQLKLQRASMGAQTPAHVKEEIREAEEDLKSLAPIVNGTISDRLLDALRQFGLPSSVSSALLRLDQELYKFQRSYASDREADRQDRVVRQNETDERFSRMERLLWAISITIAVVVASFLTYLATRGGSL